MRPPGHGPAGEELTRRLTDLLGARVLACEPVAGGDACLAHRARIDGGSGGPTTVFVKSHPPRRAGTGIPVFTREAEGLAWLAGAGAVRIPRVLAVHDGVDGSGPGDGLLVLEWINQGHAAPDHDELLGRGLAGLHRAGAPGFGGPHANHVGALGQDNAPEPTWAAFYGRRRIEPLVARAVAERRLPGDAVDEAARLVDRLPELVGPPEPPARLHGDLWAGNALTDEHGAPVLVDPAVYGGHREMDLAMMRLFGGFGPAVFAAYDEVAPLAPGHGDRVRLYQLYPLLVHTILFGGGYAGAALDAMRRYR